MPSSRLPFKLYEKVPKTEQNIYGFSITNLDLIKTNSPIILCLGGSGVVGKAGANGMAKFVLNCLNTKPKANEFSVYSVVYGNSSSLP